MEVEPSTSTCETKIHISEPNIRLGFCEVCSFKEAKYTCPRCEVKTCCLKCSRIHKLELECDGQRDRAKFIPLNKFTNLDLSSDYRLLEEISRVVEVSKKGRAYKNFRLERHSVRLQKEAVIRKITLKFLPTNFVRHINNSSYFGLSTKLIYWHVDWVFVNSENFKLSEPKVPDNVKISSILHKYLIKQDDPELQEKLVYYQAADLPGIRLLLKAEQKAGKKFYELDACNTLGECLENKLIIEYPTIHVVLKDQANFYNIIDSDDDDEDSKEELQKQIKTGQQVINQIIKKSESDGSLYESMKNLLFISEYSDEEIKSEHEN